MSVLQLAHQTNISARPDSHYEFAAPTPCRELDFNGCLAESTQSAGDPLNKSQKLRANGARADKAHLAGNVGHLAKSCNAVSVCAIDSRRACHTGPVDCVSRFKNK
jgi:hypothetical protein